MRLRFGVLALLTALTGCGGAVVELGASVHVDVARLSAGDDCVLVTFRDAESEARQEVREVSLAGRPANTSLVFGVVQPSGWSIGIDVVALLLRGGCQGVEVAREERRVTLAAPLADVTLSLVEAGAGGDGGTDAGGTDAGGTDAGGSDAGATDAGGPDAGEADGGAPDAGGVDSGVVDAGAPDAGGVDSGVVDAGTPDAGPPDAGVGCTGAVRVISGGGPAAWTDVATLDAQSAIAVGNTGAIGVFTTANTFTPWGGLNCGGNYGGVWVRPADNQVFAVTTTGLRRVNGPNQCTPLAALPAGTPQSLTGLRVSNRTRLYVATTGPAQVLELDEGQSTVVARTPPSASTVYDVDGLDENTLFAVGSTSSGNKGAFWQWNAVAQAWSAPTQLGTGNSYVYAVDVVSPALAFAGGVDGLYRWNGAGWSSLGSPGFSVRGVRAFSDTEVYLVGTPSGVNAGFARWNGNGFTSPARPMTPSTLERVRGFDGCGLWAVGNGSLVVSTAP